jgi:UDP-glucose 4-epimerase
MGRRVLVTGGAGYIGSHVVLALADAGYEPLAFDDFSTGNRFAVFAECEEGNIGDSAALVRAMRRFRPEAVIHLAASIEAEESVLNPLKYYRNNVANLLNVLEASVREGVGKFIFSSSALVYGVPDRFPIKESDPLAPINPYGATKAMGERIIADLAARTGGMRAVSLRYFNAAGADPLLRAGECRQRPSHLVTLALKASLGEQEKLLIFGTDYPTPDGTCVRDYVHVSDLASAHLLALESLLSGGEGGVYNCGNGAGHSVREVVESVRRVTGAVFTVEEAGRRPGDPPMLVADSGKIRDELGWKPRFGDIDEIVRTAWEWEKKLRPKACERRISCPGDT